MEATTHGHVAMVGKSIAEGIERGEDESEKDGEYPHFYSVSICFANGASASAEQGQYRAHTNKQ